MQDDERRRFRRVQAPVFCRPIGMRLFEGEQKTIDISLGGMRIYADEAPAQGAKLELELFLPDRSSVVCRVEVAWTARLPPGSPSNYDVGLKFIGLDPRDVARLSVVLDES
jgi:hypothetical protein